MVSTVTVFTPGRPPTDGASGVRAHFGCDDNFLPTQLGSDIQPRVLSFGYDAGVNTNSNADMTTVAVMLLNAILADRRKTGVPLHGPYVLANF